MTKSIPFNFNKIKTTIKNEFDIKAEMKRIAEEMKVVLEKLYEGLGSDWNPEYSPLHTQENFIGNNAAKYQAAFTEREKLYSEFVPVIDYKIDTSNGQIEFFSHVENGQGKLNNLFYWLDLGTAEHTQQNQSPLYTSNNVVGVSRKGDTQTGIPARKYSEKIASDFESEVRSRYTNYYLKNKTLPTRDSIEWNYDPIIQRLG